MTTNLISTLSALLAVFAMGAGYAAGWFLGRMQLMENLRQLARRRRYMLKNRNGQGPNGAA